jgi:hypothetical protein
MTVDDVVVTVVEPVAVVVDDAVIILVDDPDVVAVDLSEPSERSPVEASGELALFDVDEHATNVPVIAAANRILELARISRSLGGSVGRVTN